MAVDPGANAPPPARPFLEIRPLLRAPGIASDAKKLILAVVGLLALQAGWMILARGFGGDPPSFPAFAIDPAAGFVPDLSAAGLGGAAAFVAEPYRVVLAPFVPLFGGGLGLSGWFQMALMALWAAAVWGIVGGAIARIAVVQASGEGRVGLGSALRFALGKAASLIGAPLTPMLAVALLAIGPALFGLLLRIPGQSGGMVATALGFVPLLFALVMALILAGLALGWPLMHATVAAEGEDAPDALSRSYSYVNQRLARYLAHAAASLLIGGLGFLAAILFARLVLGLSDWGVSLGAPAPEAWTDSARSGRVFWGGVVGLVVRAWAYSYFWSAASIVYLILRRDVDGTAWHDVYQPEHAADTFAGEPEAPAKGPEAEVG